MNRIYISIFFLFGLYCGSTSIAQTSNPSNALVIKEKKTLKIEDCFNPKYYPQSPKMVSWIGGSNEITELKDGNLMSINVSSGERKILIASDSFIKLTKSALKATLGEDIKLNMPNIHWQSPYKGWFETDRFVMSIDLNRNSSDAKNKQTSPVRWMYTKNESKDEVMATEFSENADRCALVKNNNIFIVGNAQIGKNVQITKDGGNGIVYGQSVHRNEFGISKGLFWNAAADKLAYYRMDERRVKDYPMFNISEKPAKPSTIKYPMAGDSSHTVSVGVYHLKSNHVIYLNTQGSYDHYLTNITWTPDGNFIYISWVNRQQNRMELRKYDAMSGALMSIDYVLTHPKYVEPESGPIFIPGSNTDFILQSESDGFNHLYLFKFLKGFPIIKQITKGPWEVTDVLGFTKDGKYVIYESTMQSPLERTVYAIDWSKTKTIKLPKAPESLKSISLTNLLVHKLEPSHNMLVKPILLTDLKGTNKCFWNKEAGKLLDWFSSSTTPRTVLVIDVTGPDGLIYSKNNTISSTPFLVFESENPINEFGLGKVEIQNRLINGYLQYSRIFYPSNFDPNKKYPVVVYVYGGPHAQMITNTWLAGGNLWMHFMAENGYIVYTQDNRGSSHRGLEFENATHRQLGTVEMADQLDGLAWLKSQNWCDTTRVGIHGWSFGGFMTTSLMTRTPGKYKVGVAGGPVIDWSYYEIMYTERYMDMPSENPEGYKSNNLLNYADKLQGKLLMIHGADDDVVVWQHSLMFVDKTVKSRNVNLDYFVYPGHKHNVVGPDRVHLYKKISQYFFDFL